MIALAGCGGGDDPSEPASQTTTPTATATPAATPTGDGTRSEETLARAGGTEPEVDVLAAGLEVPWDIAFLPDGRALVTERPGRVRLASADGELRDESVADVSVQAVGEGGLLGVAVDPAFEDGFPFVYLMATQEGEVRVVRYAWDDGRSALTEDGVVLDGIQAGTNHNAGRLRFGPDDRLYVPTGDAFQRQLAQDRSSLNGKVLSLSRSQYRAATDGPRVVSIGHRNPQGLDWQPDSDRLFLIEHGPSGDGGPSCCDEVNIVTQGGNGLWPSFGDDQAGDGAPVKLWEETIAPSGGDFVSLPGSTWTGDLLVAALAGTSLRRLEVDGASIGDEQTLLDGAYGRLRAVVEAPDGAIWATTSNRDGRGSPEEQDDRVLRILPPAG
jgi:glucose/arabinose dehydrogenase